MFKSITHLEYRDDKCYYKLVDSEFACEVSSAAIRYSTQPTAAPSPAAAAALEYKKRNLPVAKNIALLYRFYYALWYKIKTLLEHDKCLIDRYHPELEYGFKYYSCVLNQFRKLQFSSRVEK